MAEFLNIWIQLSTRSIVPSLVARLAANSSTFKESANMFSAQSIAAYLFFLVTIHEYFLSFADAACYLPNGQEAVGDTPCNPNGDSICCPGDAGASVCLSNGLCFVPSQNVIARSSCTDQSWSSSACTPYCKNGKTSEHQMLTKTIRVQH